MTSIFSTLFILLDAALPPKGYFFVRETLPWILVVAILIIAAVVLIHTIKRRRRKPAAEAVRKPEEGLKDKTTE